MYITLLILVLGATLSFSRCLLVVLWRGRPALLPSFRRSIVRSRCSWSLGHRHFDHLVATHSAYISLHALLLYRTHLTTSCMPLLSLGSWLLIISLSVTPLTYRIVFILVVLNSCFVLMVLVLVSRGICHYWPAGCLIYSCFDLY